MTSLPDWLVERAALDEVPPTSRTRLDEADPRELADRIATLRAANEAELSAYPASVAVRQLETRIAGEQKRQATQRRNRRFALLGIASGALAIVVLVLIALPGTRPAQVPTKSIDDDGIRIKGRQRLLAFRQAGDKAEQLEQDMIVHPGDLIQLRYNGGGHSHGVIASVDGAGVVTLHFPSSEDGSTALATKTTALPDAYVLDDAPRFERFIFVAADEPIDVRETLATLRTFARRGDSASAFVRLPTGFFQWSLRLRKPTPRGAP